MWANSMAEFAGKTERGYACRKCGGQKRRVSWVDEFVEAAIVAWLSQDNVAELLDRNPTDYGPEITINAELEELERKRTATSVGSTKAVSMRMRPMRILTSISASGRS